MKALAYFSVLFIILFSAFGIVLIGGQLITGSDGAASQQRLVVPSQASVPETSYELFSSNDTTIENNHYASRSQGSTDTRTNAPPQFTQQRTISVYEHVSVSSDIRAYNRNRRSERTTGSVIISKQTEELVEEVPLTSVDALSEADDVLEVYPNYEYMLLGESLNTTPYAQATETVASSLDKKNLTGAGIVVAVLDTGVNLEDVVAEQSFVAAASVRDLHGHGTQVASILLDYAPQITLLSGKVLNDDGIGTSFSIGSGIAWALEQDAQIIVLGLGSPYVTHDPYIEKRLAEAHAADVIVIVAAGNCRQGCSGFTGVTYPGLLRDVMTVGSVDIHDELSSFSSIEHFGSYTKPETVALGEQVPAVDLAGSATSFTGTSASTPYVASVVARLLENTSSLQQDAIFSFFMTHAPTITGYDVSPWIISEMLFAESDELNTTTNVPPSTPIIETNETGGNQTSQQLFAYEGIFATTYADEGIPPENTSIPEELSQELDVFELAATCQGDRICGFQCWGACQSDSHPWWNCKGDGTAACCPVNYPFYYDGGCHAHPANYGCSITYPNRCTRFGFDVCLSPNWACSQSGVCGGELFHCVDPYSVPSCDSTNTPRCCPQETPEYWERDNTCRNVPESSCNDACSAPGVGGCAGTTAYTCGTGSDGCYEWQLDGIIAGRCGVECTSDSHCNSDQFCSSNVCVTSFCGDGRCDPGEHCPEDCVIIDRFHNPPFSVDEGSDVSIGITLENVGDTTQHGFLEVGIVPQRWAGSAYPQSLDYEAQGVFFPGCCSANTFYSDRLVYDLSPYQRKTYAIPVTVPSQSSVDACNNLGSAWDSSFNIIAGLFDRCGDGYTDFLRRSVIVNERSCSGNSDCPSAYNSDLFCKFNDVYYTRTTYTCNNGFCEESEQDIRDRVCHHSCAYGACLPPEDTCDGQPDGSSYYCSCSSDSDCNTGYYCRHVSGPNACEPILYTNECNQVGFSCEGGNVVECYDAGTHLRKRVADSCGRNEFCDEHAVAATKSCTALPNHMEIWVAYAQPGVSVNKQAGDTFEVHYYLERSDTVTFTYDTDVFSGNCYLGTYSVAAGTHTCTLTINDDVSYGSYPLSLNAKYVTISVIDYPRTVYLTHSDKLYERYVGQETGVKAILAKTYEMAERDGYVLDLKQLDNHPFDVFRFYNERVTSLSFTPNEYVLDASALLQQRCNGCESVIIVGDDFVVPKYRRDITHVDRHWLFWNKYTTRDIATDIPYIAKDMLEFKDHYKMFQIDGRYQGKSVLFILPDHVTHEQREAIERLKQTYEEKEYNPRFEEMSGTSAACVDNRWFSDVRGSTLIIIGTEENNNAFKCMPFVAGDMNRDTLFIQPNVWDMDEYALIMNTNNAEVIETFRNLIKTGKIDELSGYSAYMVKVGSEYLGYAAAGIGIAALTIGTGGTGTAVLLGGAAIATNLVADGAYITNDCVVNYDSAGICAFSVGMGAMFFANSAQVRALWNTGTDIFSGLTSTQRNNIDTIFRRMSDDLPVGMNPGRFRSELRRHDPRDIQRAHEVLGINSITDLRVVQDRAISEVALTQGLADVGYLARNNVDLVTPAGPNRQIWINQFKSANNPGLIAEARVAVTMMQGGRNRVIAIGKDINGKEFDIFARNADGRGIVSSVKNNRQLNVDSLNDAIDDLISVRNFEVAGIPVDRLQLVITREMNSGLNLPTNRNILRKIEDNNIELIIFERVR